MTAVAAAGLYIALWIGYLRQWPPLTRFDDWFLDPLHRFGVAHPAWVTAWDVFCTVLGPGGFRIVVLIATIWLLTRRQLRIALFLLLTVEFSAIVTEAAKGLVDRPRPSTALVYASSTSFPSGHALGVMVSVLALLTVCLPVIAARWRLPLIMLGAVVVIAIGVGRVVLNVHHPTDVLAGWALGYLYYLLCLPVLTARAGTPAEPDTGT